MRCRDVPALDEPRCPQMGHFSLVWHLHPGPQATDRACVQILEQDRFTPELPAASIDITANTTGLPGNSIATLWSICRDVQWKRFDLFSRRVTPAHSCPSNPCVKVYSR